MLGEVLFCESNGRHAIWGASEVLFCELDGWVLRGMQFGVLVEVPRARGMQFGDGRLLGGHVVWGWVLGGMSFGALPLCEIGGRVLGGVQFGVLVDAVLRA